VARHSPSAQKIAPLEWRAPSDYCVRAAWSLARLEEAALAGPILINDIVSAEPRYAPQSKAGPCSRATLAAIAVIFPRSRWYRPRL